LKDLQLLTAKPGIFILNSDKADISPELNQKIKDLGSEYIIANLRDEYDGSKFSEEEKKELGLSESKLAEIITKSYKVLGLITFLTAGADETRAWTIKEGTLAPQAAGVIHTDFENKFICLDVMQWDKLVEIGKANLGQDAWSLAARQGLLKMQGKEYAVQDGDVIEVKHGQ
jgi:ribosome-binding ATPase